jgi:hypothetical protein
MRFLKLYEEWKNINSFINESLSTARTRFLDTEKVTEKEFEEALGFDLSTNKKYIEKILDFYLKGKHEDEESIQQIGVTIKRFDTLVNRNKIAKTDINYFKNYKSLRNAVEDAEIEEVEKEATDLKSGDFIVIKDNKDLLVVVPQSHEASQEWGNDTKWCTTSSSDIYWKDYTLNKEINLFYIMVKNISLIEDWYYNVYNEMPDEYELGLYTKMAVAVYPYGDHMECFNRNDDSIYFEIVQEITGLEADSFEWKEIEKPYWWYDVHSLELDPSNADETEDGTIDYDGDVYIPNYTNPSEETYLGSFRKISGDLVFENPRNYDVTSMKDCYLPIEVGSDFIFTNTNIENLIGSPKIVGKDYVVSDNTKLISIEGFPESVEGNFYYKGTPLSNSRNSMIRMTAEEIRKHVKVEGLVINDLGEWEEGESDTKPFYHPSQISMFNNEE